MGDMIQLELLEPGSIHVVIGRPQSGVSTTLAMTCASAVDAGVPAVLASWERPADGWGGVLDRTDVARPEIMSWGLGQLGRCPEVDGLDDGGVVAIDYLQLIAHPGGLEDCMATVATMSTERRWRAVVGAMAPRELVCIETDLPPRRALGDVRRALGPVVDQAASMTILTGPPAATRRVVASQRSGSWHVREA